MATEIIKDGDEKTFQGKCRFCSTDYTYTNQEVNFYTRNDKEEYMTVSCPKCKRETEYYQHIEKIVKE